MKHIDLFSGIGGFALASDRVWPGIEHTFVEHDPFCQAVLKKHYPNSTIHGDIRAFIADTEREGLEGAAGEKLQRNGDGLTRNNNEHEQSFILTGGFPCQPFSHAGRRKGTDDDRYLWPEMFRVIQLYRPTWVIAENVRGLVTWNEGMVLETVCADLEREGYEVQPIVVPACAVGAPHRRDRVWIVAHAVNNGQRRTERGSEEAQDSIPTKHRTQHSTTRESERTISDGVNDRPWEADWREVALATCHDGLDDGLPRQMDGVTISASRHRKEQLKAYGNAIVPQVAERIMRAIPC